MTDKLTDRVAHSVLNFRSVFCVFVVVFFCHITVNIFLYGNE